MNLKVLSIFNNAKTFLTDSEMLELAELIIKNSNSTDKKKVIQGKLQLQGWSIEEITEKLLQTHFRKKKQ